MKKGSLYIVATPIGNLEDITLRALRVLKEVYSIASEDTRRTKILLDKYNIEKDMIPYHEHNKRIKSAKILGMLEEGKDIALVSDAGTPCISDPGSELVRDARERGIRVIPIPGPSALTTALSISGLNLDSFYYIGFLPKKRKDLTNLLEGMKYDERHAVCFESPHRLLKTLNIIKEMLGTRKIIFFKELTKIYEDVIIGTASVIIQSLLEKQAIKGECIILITGDKRDKPDSTELQISLRRLFRAGFKMQEISDIIRILRAASRNTVYKEFLRFQKEEDI